MPDDYRISDLSTTPSIGNSDLMELSVVNSASESGYTSMKAPVLNLANKIVNETQYVSDLQTQNKTITGAINEVAQGGGGDADIVKTASGNPCSFSTSFAGKLKSLTAEIVASGGGGTPSNPIPIVGHTELNLTRCGVNLWDEEWEQGYYNASGNPVVDSNAIRSKNYIPVKPSSSVYWYNGTDSYGRIQFYDVDKNWLNTDTNSNRVINIPNNCYYIKISTGTGYGGTYNNDISINYPATNTEYNAYNGQTFTVAFGQTVYGGVVDVTRGKLRVTWISVDLGDLDYTMPVANTFVCLGSSLPSAGYPVVAGGANPVKCENYATAASGRYASNYEDKTCGLSIGGTQIIVKDTTYSDTTTFKSGVDGVMFAYELATPIVIDVQAISVFAENGTNNITSDGGGDVDVEYYTDLVKDIKDFIGDGVEVGDLANVEITTPSNNQVLKYDATSQKWVNGTGGGGASDLDDLGDVEITTPSNDQVLKYDSTSQKWVNGNASGGSGHNYSTTEQVVGTWIDGSTIYETTIYCDSFPNNTSKTLTTPQDLDMLIDAFGFMRSKNQVGYYRTLPFAGGGTNDVRVDLNGSDLLVLTFANWSDYEGYITVRYTKSV